MMDSEMLKQCTILLVDDEEANLDLLEGILEDEGYRRIVRTSDARQATSLFEARRPDLVLLDLHMPHRTGFEVLQELRQRTLPGDYLPVLVLTADVTPEAKERALSGGARDFLIKPFDTVEVALRVRNLLEARLLHRLQREARARAEVAEARSALLAEVSGALAMSLDGTTSLATLPGLLAPRWAEGCAAFILESGRLLPVAARHADPARERGLAEALITGIESRLLERAEGGERSMVVTRQSITSVGAPSSRLIAPVRVQGRMAGVLILEREGEGATFAAEERALFEEVAARAALALENARLLAQAELATRARDRMLSVVAHDLRNPLAVVGMYGEMLLSMLPPEGDEYSRNALTSIYQTTGRIQRMVEDLLDVSALEQGAFSLCPERQPLEPLMHEAERMLAPLAAARGLTLRFVADPSAAGQPVLVDGARLIQLLSNLVGNALKFTPEGGVVEVGWQVAGRAMEICISDTGPGIPADKLPHVFGAFWQAREADRRGVGLGLWIARAIVDGHGGRIWVDSTEGRGATFRFTLPLPPSGSERPRAPVPVLRAE